MSHYFYSHEFKQFLPYVYAKKAGQITGDALRKNRYRVEVKERTPYVVRQKMLAYRAQCCACPRVMAPFRLRKDGSIYVNEVCRNADSSKCSRGDEATFALDLLVKLVRDGDDRPPYEAPRLEGME